MQHIGDFGHLAVIISFISAILATYAYFKASNENLAGAHQWKQYARGLFALHGTAVLSIVVTLFAIIYTHDYRFHYAWSHSSNELPIEFMISCFWEGQEGSFLLWIFWHVILGAMIIATAKKWEAPVMTVFMGVQIFLASMILGVVLGDIKIGSSPFILLKEVLYNAPIFDQQPDFVPENGNGLNPLLQNYWMVIHPPTLFLGFAATLVPFAFCIAGLWKKRYSEWVSTALPWTLFAAMILGTGIIMGGIWAYETLNFGGYWNWDPVENAVFVPWLTLIAAVHTMILYKRKGTAIKVSVILVITTFLLILYSTFLTRSGVLGESSVHSFTDLGLSGQLLIYLLAFVVLSVILAWRRWRHLPSSEEETNMYSKEFWIFIAVAILSLAAFQVIIATSIPVFNKIAQFFGGSGNMAPPTDQETFYSNFQIWAGIAIVIFGGIAQYIWWHKFNSKQLKKLIPNFLVISATCLLVALLAIGYMDLNHGILTDLIHKMKAREDEATSLLLHYIFRRMTYVLLLGFSLFSLVSAVIVMKKISQRNINLSGGAISHIGVALMLIGILFSSGYSKVVSLNNTGRIYSREFSDEMNTENIFLWSNVPSKMKDYELTYEGRYVQSPALGDTYIPASSVIPIRDERTVIVIKDIKKDNNVVAPAGDTITIAAENVYYKVRYEKPDGSAFHLYPRAQNNPDMGFLASPDVRTTLTKDLYTHVASVPDPEKVEWSQTETHVAGLGDTLIINDYIGIVDSIKRTKEVPGVKLNSSDLAVTAYVNFMAEGGRTRQMAPVFLILNGQSNATVETAEDLGIRLIFDKVDPNQNAFTFKAQTTQKDYIIMKAIEKPLINLLWLGTGLLVIGFLVAMRRWYLQKRKQLKPQYPD